MLTLKVLSKIFFGVLIVAVLMIGFFYSKFTPNSNPTFGVTFSPAEASGLGLDWKTVYLDALHDLKPANMRLVLDWAIMEDGTDKLNFQIYDEILIEAEKQNVDVVLVFPVNRSSYVNESYGHFKQFGAIKAWEITDMDSAGSDFNFISQTDERPIILSYRQKGSPDISSVQIHRVIYSESLGYLQNPLPPIWYKIKSGAILQFINSQDIIGTYIQGSPKTVEGILATDLQTQKELMNPLMFLENVDFAKQVGFSEFYLSGLEWWYWMAHKQNDWGMWDAAKHAIR